MSRKKHHEFTFTPHLCISAGQVNRMHTNNIKNSRKDEEKKFVQFVSIRIYTFNVISRKKRLTFQQKRADVAPALSGRICWGEILGLFEYIWGNKDQNFSLLNRFPCRFEKISNYRDMPQYRWTCFRFQYLRLL